MHTPARRQHRKTPLLQPLALAAVLALGAGPAHTATRTWIGPGASFWDLLANWDSGLPGTLDDVALGGFDTIFRQNTVNIRSFVGTGQLQLTGGVLGISAASSIGTLFVNGGTLTGNTTVAAGAFSWNAGTLGVYQQNTQLLVNVAGTATLDGVNTKFIQGGSVLSLNGASTWNSGASTIYLQGIGGSSTVASRLVIGSGGTFDDKGNGAAERSIANYSYNGASVDIASGGIYTKSAGTGKTSVGVLFNNSGTANVNAGTLSLTVGGTSSGSFAVLAGATLGFDGGTHTVSGAVSNAGTLQNNGGTTTLSGLYSGSGAITVGSGTLTIAANVAPTNLNLNGGSFVTGATATAGTATFSGGAATGNGTINTTTLVMNAGTLGTYQQDTKTKLNVAGTATLDGANTKFLQGGSVLSLNGASTWNSGAGTIYLQGVGAASTSASKLVIGSGGTFDDKGNGTADRSIAVYSYNGAALDITSGGVYTKSAGTGKTTIGVLLNNSGAVNVNAGTLSLTGGGASSGSFVVQAGTTLGFDGGTHTISGAVSNAGSLQNNGGTTTLSGLYSGIGDITVGSGTLTVAGNVTPANLNLNGGSFVSTAITTAGTASFSGGTATGNGTVNATTLVLNNGSFGSYQADTKTKFNVSGTATLDGANTKFIYGGATLALNGASTWNSGAGTIYLQGVGAASTTASKLVIGNGGTFDDKGNGTADRSIASYSYVGASMDIAAGASYTKSTGTGKTTVGVLFNNSGTANVNVGTLSLTGGGGSSGSFSILSTGVLGFDGGTHTVSGAVSNAGVLQNNGGTTTLSGAYSGSGNINVGSGTLTVATNLAPTNLNLDGGSFTTGAIATVGTATFTGGAATGNGTINATTLVMNAGTLGSYQQDTKTKFNVAGIATLDGPNAKFIMGGATLTLNGATTWNSGASPIYLQGAGAASTTASKLAIASGATFNDKGNGASNRSISNYSYTGGLLDNAGTYTKSAGTGATSIDVVFNNTGTLLVQAGAVHMSVGGTSTGTFQSGAAGAVNFTGGTHNLNGVTLTNDGLMNISSGTVKVNGTSSYGGAGTLNVNGGTLEVAGTLGPAAAVSLSSGGIITGAGTLNAGSFSWANGNIGTYQQNTPLLLNVAGSLALDGSNAKYVFGGATVNLNGGAVWATGTSGINLQGIGASSTAASTMVVSSGQTFEDKGNAAASHSISGYGYNGGQFNVASGATYLRSAGTGSTAINGVAFNVAGTANVQAGKLSLQSGGAASGTFQTGAAGVVSFDGGTYTLTDATFDNAGQVNVTGGIVNLAGSVTYGGSGSLNVSGGVLNVPGTLGPAATVQLSASGTISGAGTVNAGTFIWNGGSLGVYPQDTQTRLNVSGTATLDGANTKYILGGATATLNGASTWNTGSAPLYLQGVAGSSTTASRLVIGSSGTFDDKGNGANNRSISNYAGTGALVSNLGKYTKSGGTGTTTVDILFNSSGTVESQVGTLSLNSGGASTGTFKAASGATLAFGGGTHTLTASSFDNAGTIGVTGGIVNLVGVTSYTGTGAIAVTGGLLNVAGTLGPAANVLLSNSGAISGPGTVNAGAFTWNGGAIGVYPQDTQTKFNVAGTATLDGASTKYILGGATATLNGVSTWNAGSAPLYVQGVAGASTTASRLVIGSGGTFDDKGNGANNRSISNYAGTGALVNNLGTYTKSGGTGTTSVDVAFNSSGTVNVQAGVLSLTGGGTASGSFVTGLGASTNLGTGYALTDGALFSGAGEFAVVGTVTASGTVSNNNAAVLALRTGNLTGNASSAVNTDALNWTAGNLGVNGQDTQIKLNVGGAATLDGANTRYIFGGATATLSGASTWNAGSGYIYLQGVQGAVTTASRLVIASGSSFEDKGNGTNTRGIGLYNGTGALVSNLGTYTKSGGTGTTTIDVLFNNSGTAESQSGTLSLNGGGASTGTFKAASGATLAFGGGTHTLTSASFDNAGTIGVTAGTVNLVGATNYTGSGTLAVNGGLLNVAGTLGPAANLLLANSGTISGAGTVNAGAFAWNAGNLGQNALNTQTQLNVAGAATLDGVNTKYIYGGATATLNGASTWNAGSSSIYLQGVIGATTTASRLVIGSGGTFDDKGNGSNGHSIGNYNGTGALLSNAGTYTKSGGTGTTTVDVLFSNTGTVNVQAGVLALSGGGSSSGSFVTGLGASTNLGTGYALSNGALFSGAGELAVVGTVTANGTVANNNAAVLALRAGTLTGGASSVVNTDALNWTAGSLGVNGQDTQIKLNVSGAATLDGANTKYIFGGATATLNGATTWNAGSGSLYLQGVVGAATTASRLVIVSGSTFDDKGNGTGGRSIGNYNGTGALLSNAGTYTKSGGTGTTTVDVLFNNSGSVNAQAGVLSLTGGGTSSGSFVAALGTATNLGNGYVLGNGTRFSGAGELGIAGTVTANGTTANDGAAVLALRNGGVLSGSATGIVNTDAFNWTGGQLGTYAVNTQNQLNVAGTAALSGTAALFVVGGSTLALNGNSAWQAGGGTIYLQGVGAASTVPSRLVIGNGGTFTDLGNGATSRNISSYGYNGGVIANNGTWQKTGGTGTTAVSNTVFTNTGTVAVSSGRFALQGGLTNFAGSTLTGGTYVVTGPAAVFSFTGANVVTNAAGVVLDGAGSSILNDSTNGDALAGFASNAAAGNFTIRNGRNFTTAAGFANAGVVTVGAASRFTSTGAFSNQATGRVQMAGGDLAGAAVANAGQINGFGNVANTVTNSGSVLASGGTLSFAAGLQGTAGSVTVDTGSTLVLGAASTARTLTNNGTLLNLGANNITVSQDYDNASFGVGNAFNRRAATSGTGLILAAGTTQQTLSGALVQNGGTASATLALPNMRVGLGALSTTFTVNDVGSGGASLRGALQNTGISNIGLSGSGVTAQNFGPVAQGSSSGAYTVSFDPTFGQALSGQSIQIVNNFDNVAGQTLAITGKAYNLAAASPATPNPVVFAKQRVGDTLSQALTLTNTAATSGFSEALNASISASGTATATGSFNLLAAGASNSTSLLVGVDTSSAGAKSGVATIALASDGTGTSGFSPFALAAQTVDVSGDVYRLAVASAATPSPVVLANQRVGGTASQVLSFINLAAADGYSESLNATIAASGTATATGSFNLLAAGATSTALSVGVNTATAGAKNGVATITLASDGTGTSGFAPLALAPQTVDVSGKVYRLASASAVSPSPVVLANQRVGGTASQALTFSNLAVVDGYSESLNATIAASGTATATGSFNLLAAGATSTALSVGVNTATAGAKSGVATITLASDGTGTSGFSPFALAPQTVDVSGKVYRLASASAVSPSPVVLANQRVGGTVSQVLSFSNLAAVDGYSESLNATIAASDTATAAGSFSLLAAGASSTALSVGVNTATAGTKSGVATITLASDGTGTSGFAPLALDAQTVDVSGKVYRLASASAVSPGPVVLAAQRVGGTGTQNLSFTNLAAADGYSESLDATIAANGAATATGSFSLLGAGASSNALTVAVNTSSPGHKSGVATITLASNGSGTSGLAAYGLGTQTVNVSGDVYRVASAASITPNPVVLAKQRVGDTLTQTLTVTNSGSLDGFSEALNATIAASGAANAAGSFNLLAAGASSTALTVGVDTATAGHKAGVATVSLASDGSGSSGLAALALAPQTIPVSGDVYRLAVASAAAPSTVSLPNQRVGGSATQALTFTNLAANDGYSEALSGTIAAGGAATVSGSFSLLAAGGSSTALTVGVNTSSAGSKSGVASISLASDGTGSSGFGALALAPQTVSVSGDVYRLAVPLVDTTPIVLFARVGDTAPSRSIAVTNNAPDLFTERLDAGLSGAPAGFSAAGSVSGLLPNASSSVLGVSLATATAGSFSGPVTVTLVSSGAGTTLAPDQALASASVGLTGRVYAPAVAQLASTTVNFGIVRVGDTVAARTVAVTNGATGALNDTLQASLGAAAAPFTAGGTVTGLAAGSSNNSALSVQVSTAAAGVYTGAALVTFTSQNPDLADLALGTAGLTLQAQVNNLASAALGKTGGAGSFSAAGLSYTLNFGTLLLGDGTATASLSLANIAGGPADDLGGAWDLSSVALGDAFTLSGFDSFSGLAAGGAANSLSVSLDSSVLGSYSRVVTLHGVTTNGSGPDLAMADVTLRLEGTVAAVPEPGSYLLFAGGMAVLGWARRRQTVRARG